MSFAQFSNTIAKAAARPTTFLASVLVVVAWAATGPVFRYSDTWQMVINTGTTIVTFWLGFLILARGAVGEAAIQAKLDELIRSHAEARNDLIKAEERDEAEIEQLRVNSPLPPPPPARMVETPKRRFWR